MKFTPWTFACLVSVMFCYGCAASAPKYETLVIKQPELYWHFRNVSAFADLAGRIVVAGKLDSGAVNLPSGHVDIAIFDATGKRLYDTTAGYTPATLDHYAKRNGGVSFATTLDSPPPEGASIKVAFHEEPYQEDHPTHEKSIVGGD